MNDEQIVQVNTIIAEACGKKYHRPTEEEIRSGVYYQYEPNYYGSLDAMHEAEKVLTTDQWREYNRILWIKAKYSPAHATSQQKAEAFIRTNNKQWPGDINP